MALTLYNTQTLIQVQQRFADLPDGFWRRLYTRVVTSDREAISFDQLETPERKLAPFVAPNVQGRVMRGQGFTTREFAPAYLKPKHVVDPSKALRRMYGEAIGGSLSAQQRFDAHVANNLRMERESIERRFDWMAAMATIYGEITISGQDYPTTTVNFLRDASLTEVLAGGGRWDQVGSDPLGDLQTKVTAAFELGHAPITDLVFGTQAWTAFITGHEDVIDLLDSTRRGSNSDFSRTGLNQVGSNYQAMGQIGSTQGGTFNLWRYSNWYHDVNEETGEISVGQFLDPRDVVGHGPALDGVAAFGAIQDAEALRAGLQEAIIYPKMYLSQDPSVLYTLSQSAPIFVPMNPNNTFRLRVVS